MRTSHDRVIKVGFKDIDRTPIKPGQIAVCCAGYFARCERYARDVLVTVIKKGRTQVTQGARKHWRNASYKSVWLAAGTFGMIIGRNEVSPSKWDVLCGMTKYTLSCKDIKIIRSSEEFSEIAREVALFGSRNRKKS